MASIICPECSQLRQMITWRMDTETLTIPSRTILGVCPRCGHKNFDIELKEIKDGNDTETSNEE